jgi:hypothetical protein
MRDGKREIFSLYFLERDEKRDEKREIFKNHALFFSRCSYVYHLDGAREQSFLFILPSLGHLLVVTIRIRLDVLRDQNGSRYPVHNCVSVPEVVCVLLFRARLHITRRRPRIGRVRLSAQAALQTPRQPAAGPIPPPAPPRLPPPPYPSAISPS